MKNSPIQLVYVSASGNTLVVVDHVTMMLEKEGFDVDPQRVELFDHEQMFDQFNRFIFAKSTWVHGELNPYFEPLLKYLEGRDLSKYEAAFIGMGDLRYDPILFCNGMEILRKAYIESNGTEITDPLKINGDPYDQLNTVVDKWVEKLTLALKELDQ